MRQEMETPKGPQKRSPFAMKCTVNRANLRPNTGTFVYVAVDLTPSAAVVAARNRGIVLAIDSSGSMDGEKIEQAKAAALGLLEQNMREAGITITAIGIGNDYNETLLEKVAEAAGGLWHHIDESGGNLPQVFQDQAAQMAGTVVANPELKVSIMPGSELGDAYSVRPVLNRLPRPRFDGTAFTVPLRDLIAGEAQIGRASCREGG